MTHFDSHCDAAGRRGASTGIRLSFAPATVVTQPSRLAVRAGGSGMNDTDRAVGVEAMR